MDFKKQLTYLNVLGIPFRIAPVEAIFHILHSAVSLVVVPVRILLTAYFIDTALSVVTNNYDASRIIMPLVAIGVFSVYNYILSPVTEILNARVSVKARLKLRVPFLEKRVRLEYKHIENPETKDLLSRVWDNPEGQLSNALNNLLHLFIVVGTVASQSIILLVNAPLAGGMLLVCSIPMFMIALKAGKYRYQAQREYSMEQRRAWDVSWYLWAPQVADERNMFGFTDCINDKFCEFSEISRKAMLKVDALWFIRSRISAVLMGLLSAIGLFILAPAVVAGNLSVGFFIALQTALFGSISHLAWGLPFAFTQIAKEREFIKDVNDFFKLSETADAETLPADTPFDFESLELRDVSFKYPGSEKLILNKLSLKIEKNKHYSIVGVNGAGKTTLTKLITRLYDDYTGEILLNGKSLKKWSMSQIKSCFCALFQDFSRYDITVAENVCMGKINGASEEEVDSALELSGFDKESSHLKDGKDTLLGKTHDTGIDLSGGQWQSLAFARAILSPSPVKILDEPTAALDPMAEKNMYARFESISQNSTTIFISHRLASAKLADVIFVIDEGNVKEEGSHLELLSMGGIYSEMFKNQQSWYQ
jgi:ATP-binding cassette subfamily B protein